MSTVLNQVPDSLAVVGEPWSSVDETTRSRIAGFLTNFRPRTTSVERRSDQRYPFPHLVHLTPVGEDNTPIEGEMIVVVGRHISERGLGFYHTKPLPYRRMIVAFETSGGNWVRFLIDLTWCRFTRDGWYESGGRFLQAIS
ncbi:MAG TPA: hypothetical protein DD670_16920 [Planctomycetaceae bacterium]|nr:hypothetical protein [Planctomycetaceae bacterium]